MKRIALALILAALAGTASAETKSLGGGTISPTIFLRVVVPNGSVAKAKVEYVLDTNDGTNWVVQGGTETLVCTADVNGNAFGQKTNVGPQVEAGVGSAPTTLLSSLSFSVVTSANTCDFRIANNVIVGAPIVNDLEYTVDAIGAGTWTAQ